MSYESTRLRQLAEAIDRLSVLKSFDYQVRGDQVRVEWQTGASCNGYKEMSHDIAVIVAEGYDALRLEAINRAEQRVAACRQALAEEQGSSSEA